MMDARAQAWTPAPVPRARANLLGNVPGIAGRDQQATRVAWSLDLHRARTTESMGHAPIARNLVATHTRGGSAERQPAERQGKGKDNWQRRRFFTSMSSGSVVMTIPGESAMARKSSHRGV